MIEETLPLRRQQLYGTYAPGGQEPLIPATQADIPVVGFGVAGGQGTQAYLELVNAQPSAVDISGWKLGGAARFTFRPGDTCKRLSWHIACTRSIFVGQRVSPLLVMPHRRVMPRL